MDTKEIIKNKNGVEVYESKFGFYPCDKETYLKLKKLNFLFLQAQKKAARWHRWAMKDPQNQVVRKAIRNEQGQKIGSEIVGQMFEPPIDSVFCSFDPEKSGWECLPKSTYIYATYGCERSSKTWWVKTNGFSKEYIGYGKYSVANAHRYCYKNTALFVDSFGVDIAYHQAKKPQNDMDSVKTLLITKEQIDKLYNSICKM